MHKRLRDARLPVAVVVVTILFAAAVARSDPTPDGAGPTAATGIAGPQSTGPMAMQCGDPPPVLNRAHPDHYRTLAPLATDIFVGRVLVVEPGMGLGTPVSELRYFFPEAHFTVQVLDVVKGTAAGTVEVRMGNAAFNLCTIRHFDPPLRSGDTAVFVANPSASGSGYSLVFTRGGYYLVEDDIERADLMVRFDVATDDEPATPEAATSPAPGI